MTKSQVCRQIQCIFKYLTEDNKKRTRKWRGDGTGSHLSAIWSSATTQFVFPGTLDTDIKNMY